MIALEIKVNNNEVYTAGIEHWDSLHAILTLINQQKDQKPAIELNVGGSLSAEDGCSGDSVRWKNQYLEVSDEISIRITETESANEPVRILKRKELEKKYDPKYTPEEREERERETYRRLKQKFGD